MSDSTVVVRYGLKQAGAERGYNPKKWGRPCHHPLLAFIRETGDCLGVRCRGGCPNRSWRLRWLSVDSCYAATSFPSTGGVPSSSRCALSIQRSL